ncbi:hypothetical protein G7054_g14188 [Neopestalotiopsis clavispora]|nr:hypothetical protein G7054_g14188 [Neopestalotiopsis clavispora]
MEELDPGSTARPQSSGASLQMTRTTVRRSHKKSRNGCRYCKQRRIKCDETKPICGNCAHSSIICDYTPKEDNVQPIVSRGRGRPRKDWTAVTIARSGDVPAALPSASLLTNTLPAPADVAQLPLYTPLHMQWGADDMQLFFHYLTAVAVDTGDDQLWKYQLPRIAFRHHTILHLILALAALHLARSEPGRSAELMAQAEAHMNVGLRRATQDLANLNEQNCAELYMTTILICTYNFARTPGPRNLLVVADGHESAWWNLFRGVRVVIERIGHPTILARLAQDAGAHDAVLQPKSVPASPPEGEFTMPTLLDWENALDLLHRLVEHVSLDRKSIYHSTCNMLKWCFHDTFGSKASADTVATPKFQTIMAWLYVLDDRYVEMLRENDPLAMLLLAYFAILLQTLERVWFLKGWAIHILRGVREILSETSQEQWLPWLQWPQTQVDKIAKTIAAAARAFES